MMSFLRDHPRSLCSDQLTSSPQGADRDEKDQVGLLPALIPNGGSCVAECGQFLPNSEDLPLPLQTFNTKDTDFPQLRNESMPVEVCEDFKTAHPEEFSLTSRNDSLQALHKQQNGNHVSVDPTSLESWAYMKEMIHGLQ